MNITKMREMPVRSLPRPLLRSSLRSSLGLSKALFLRQIVLTLAGVLVSACETKGNGASSTSEASIDAAATMATADASRDGETTARLVFDAGPPKIQLTPLVDSEKAAYDAFRKAIARGRELTHKKDYAGAIKSYDAALVAMPNDPRALGERGFARLEAKDYAGALRDCDAARMRAPTPELEAQIWFNIGQAEEGLGHAEAARAAYVQVQNRRPSAAAAKHLIGLSQCDAYVDRDAKPGKVYPNWLAAFHAFDAAKIAAWNDSDAPHPKTNDDAQKAICGAACTGEGPWLVTVGDPAVAAEIALVAPQDAGKILVFHHLGDALGGRCAFVDDAVLERGSPVHVRIKDLPSSLLFVRTDSLGEIKECELDVAVCQSACITQTWTERDYFFDLTARAQVLLVEQSGRPLPGGTYTRSVAIARKPDTIHLHGGGCDTTIPVGAK